MRKLFASGILMLDLTASVFAQITVNATAAATILTPITMVKVTDMNFGNLAVSATVAGTVLLPPAAAPVRVPTAGVTLMSGGTVTAAQFTVSGLAGATYSIALPADGDVVLIGPGGAGVDEMEADDFTSSPTPTGTLTGGTETLYVGATLTVDAAETPGVYTSAAFPVTVNYN